MEQELYLVDEISLIKLIGFGPAKGNNGNPPIRAILNNQVFTCEYYNGKNLGEKADIYFPKRNYILPDEFNSVNLIGYVEQLIKNGDQFIMDVGEGWVDERSFLWKRESEEFSKKFKVQRAIRINDWFQITRALQAYNELVLIDSLPERHEEINANEKIDIARQIKNLFSLEASLLKFDQNNKKPNLDQIDGTFV